MGTELSGKGVTYKWVQRSLKQQAALFKEGFKHLFSKLLCLTCLDPSGTVIRDRYDAKMYARA